MTCHIDSSCHSPASLGCEISSLPSIYIVDLTQAASSPHRCELLGGWLGTVWLRRPRWQGAGGEGVASCATWEGRQPDSGGSGLARCGLEVAYVKQVLWMEGKKGISQPKLTG